ncbi:hypothetical protein [Amycolatopsis sp. FDAARGOS 1241]|uniref:hypothetical protein n=1 Tax=Amycolatopsis sp. FDAARGOS 1241 TaxID=2778070 RepID=UPI0019525D90|nr:hypothetical protein [Amycolatopsis sp. FDAARGOS 1241]QRP49186.1 hypothetical protein I6J71_16240 [Amycolatopsis sp. FDAARGOS 1241]
MRMLRALTHALTGSGWVVTPPSSPLDAGFVVPVPRPGAHDSPHVPLSKHEREAFLRITCGFPGDGKIH